MGIRHATGSCAQPGHDRVAGAATAGTPNGLYAAFMVTFLSFRVGDDDRDADSVASGTCWKRSGNVLAAPDRALLSVAMHRRRPPRRDDPERQHELAVLTAAPRLDHRVGTSRPLVRAGAPDAPPGGELIAVCQSTDTLRPAWRDESPALLVCWKGRVA